MADVEIVKNEYVIKRSEIVDEITTVLKEWHGHFKRFFLVSLAFTKVFRKLNNSRTLDKQLKSQSHPRENA